MLFINWIVILWKQVVIIWKKTIKYSKGRSICSHGRCWLCMVLSWWRWQERSRQWGQQDQEQRQA